MVEEGVRINSRKIAEITNFHHVKLLNSLAFKQIQNPLQYLVEKKVSDMFWQPFRLVGFN